MIQSCICIIFTLTKKNIALGSGSCGCISASWTGRICHGSGLSTTETQREETCFIPADTQCIQLWLFVLSGPDNFSNIMAGILPKNTCINKIGYRQTFRTGRFKAFLLTFTTVSYFSNFYFEIDPSLWVKWTESFWIVTFHGKPLTPTFFLSPIYKFSPLVVLESLLALLALKFSQNILDVFSHR